MLTLVQFRGCFRGSELAELEFDAFRSPGYTPVTVRHLRELRAKLWEKVHPALRSVSDSLPSIPDLPVDVYTGTDPYPPFYEGDLSKAMTARVRSASGRPEGVEFVMRNSARLGKEGRVMRDIGRLTTLDAGPTSLNVPYVWGSLGVLLPISWGETGAAGLAASAYPSHALLVDGQLRGLAPLESGEQVRALLNSREACPLTRVTPRSEKLSVKFAGQRRSDPMDLRGSGVPIKTYGVDLASGRISLR